MALYGIVVDTVGITDYCHWSYYALAEDIIASYKVEMPTSATLYASTDVNSMAAPFVPGPALYVEPTLNQQVAWFAKRTFSDFFQLASPYQPRKAVGPFYWVLCNKTNKAESPEPCLLIYIYIFSST